MNLDDVTNLLKELDPVSRRSLMIRISQTRMLSNENKAKCRQACEELEAREQRLEKPSGYGEWQ